MICLSGVFGSPPSARTYSQSITCVANGDDQALKEETEPSSGISGRSIQQNSASHFSVENEKEVRISELFCCVTSCFYMYEYSSIQFCSLYVMVNKSLIEIAYSHQAASPCFFFLVSPGYFIMANCCVRSFPANSKSLGEGLQEGVELENVLFSDSHST